MVSVRFSSPRRVIGRELVGLAIQEARGWSQVDCSPSCLTGSFHFPAGMASRRHCRGHCAHRSRRMGHASFPRATYPIAFLFFNNQLIDLPRIFARFYSSPLL